MSVINNLLGLGLFAVAVLVAYLMGRSRSGAASAPDQRPAWQPTPVADQVADQAASPASEARKILPSSIIARKSRLTGCTTMRSITGLR